MGLNPNPNESLQVPQSTSEDSNPDAEKIAFMGFMTLPTGNLIEKNPSRQVLSRSDQEYLILLINKYGLNFKKMSYDLKFNHLQYTEQRLEKMFEKYQSLTEAQKTHRTPLTLPTPSN